MREILYQFSDLLLVGDFGLSVLEVATAAQMQRDRDMRARFSGKELEPCGDSCTE
jgi:hypothetical protein